MFENVSQAVYFKQSVQKLCSQPDDHSQELSHDKSCSSKTQGSLNNINRSKGIRIESKGVVSDDSQPDDHSSDDKNSTPSGNSVPSKVVSKVQGIQFHHH